MNNWLAKYEACDTVDVIERQLTVKEAAMLEDEKVVNAAAQAGRGGDAQAVVARDLAETFLRNHIETAHPTARESMEGRPFGIAWDAWYILD